jgi:recombination protein RecT
MVNNSLVQKTQKQKFSVAIQGDAYKNLINNTLGNPKKAERFIAAVSSAVAVNPALQECDAGSIVSSALLGESLNLSPSPQLGQYYMVPFNDKKRNCKIATFILGAKGYKQLAMRSGQYLDIDVIEVKEGEFKGRDKHTGKQKFEFIEDENEREKLETIGYLAYFELLNGFKKSIYWTKEKMEAHADKYSAAFSLKSYKLLQEGKIPQSEMWKYSSYWYTSFSQMSEKTMIRQLISQWGIMSIDLQKAFEVDIDAEQKETAEFVENETVDNFFEDTETPEEVKQDEVIQPDKSNKTTKNDKNKAVDMHEVEEGLTEEEKAIFGQENFFNEQ